VSAVAVQTLGLRAALGGVEILHGLDLSLPAGRWTCIVGPNGAGKSTLLKVLAGLLPHTGEVRLLGTPMQALSGRERARQLAWLGQSEGSAEDLSAWDVAMLGRLPHQAWLAAPSAADHAAVEQALRATQAWDWRERPLASSPAASASACCWPARWPCRRRCCSWTNPWPTSTRRTRPTGCAWCASRSPAGRTVVSVLHEISLALHADELVIVSQGQVAWQGACADAATHRALEQVFEDRIAIHPLAGQWVALPK
jgi:iron complex transport system ATP-binding protein